MSKGLTALPVLVLACLAGGGAVLGQPPMPLGGELLVNAYTSNDQSTPAIASDAAGNFVVVWRSNLQDGSGFGIFGRRFSSAGVPLAGEFQVNTSTSSYQLAPAVDMNASGAFVISWEAGDGSTRGVFTRRFDSAGAAQGGELQVNTYTTSLQQNPAVGIDSEGDFVVVFNSFQFASTDVFARRFNAAGVAVSTPFIVNVDSARAQVEADVDLEPDGDFVVVWSSKVELQSTVLGRRFNSSGIAQNVQFAVPAFSNINSYQDYPRVGVDADGDFVVVWQSFEQDGDRYGVFARRFTSAVVPITGDLQANVQGPGLQRHQDVAVDATGDFVVVWTSAGFEAVPAQDGDQLGVFGRRFHANGTVDTAELLVNTVTMSSQQHPAVASDADGDFVVAWTSEHTATPGDIFAQRFGVQPLFDVDGNGVFEPLADGLLILRFGFGFTGATLISGAVGAGCTRCDAPSITAFLQSFV